MGSNKSQCKQILDHLADGRRITSADALAKYSVARLASRINDLKNAGHQIGKTMIPAVNRFGDTVHVAEYFLVERHIDVR